MTFRKEYIVYIVIILVCVLGVIGRVYVQKRYVAQLNERIEQLTETTNIQKAQIDEMTARLRAKQAEIDSVNQYTKSVETILDHNEDLNHEIIETISTDEASMDWYHSPVPDDICNILHERLCDRPCGGYKD